MLKSIIVSTTSIYMETNIFLNSTDSDNNIKWCDYDNYTKPEYQPINIHAENNVDKIWQS